MARIQAVQCFRRLHATVCRRRLEPQWPQWLLLQCPALILQHRNNALAPVAVGEDVHQHLAGSTLQVLDVAGHCAHMSPPGLIIGAMRRYLGQVLGNTPSHQWVHQCAITTSFHAPCW